MRSSSTKKLLLGGVVALAFGIAAVVSINSSSDAEPAKAAPADAKSDHTMLGGTLERNMVNLVDKGVPDKLDIEGDKVAWKAELGSRAYGGPIVGSGKIFVGTNNEQPRNKRDKDKDGAPIDRGILMCFDEKTGKFLWQAVHDKLPSGLVHDWPKEGICSTPVVEGDKVYYTSNRCTIVCADINGLADGNQGIQTEKYKDATDADIIWEYDMMKELNVFPHNMSACSPLIIGDMMFIVTANGVDEGHINIPSPEAPSFIALDKKTGKLLWKNSAPGKNIMHGQWSNPVLCEIDGVRQVIFPGGDGWLRAFVPETGEEIWRFDCNPKNAVYELGGAGTRNDFIATPVVHQGRIYIGVGQDPEHSTGIGNFFCIAPKKDKKGDISKSLETREKGGDGKEKIGEKPNPNSCEVWRYGGIEGRKFAPRDFKFGRTMSSAAIVDGFVYVSELSGILHCLDVETGKHYWSYDTKTEIWGSPYYVDGKVLLPTSAGDLFIFKHDKDKTVYDVVAAGENAANLKEARNAQKAEMKKVADRFLLSRNEFPAPIRSTPVVANGVLYVMTENTLYALKTK